METGQSVTHGGWLRMPQGKLGQTGLIVLITLVNIIMPFSTDMYTPAIPSLPEHFGTTEPVVNLTLIGFFVFMTFAMLVFGPLSDRFGRKPIFVGSMVIYTAGSLLCAVSGSIGMLIVSRIVQSIGAGGAVAVSTALVKDCFVEDKREKIIALLQVLGVVGPVASPLIGGFLLRFFSWHASFFVLGGLGAVSLLLTLLFEESLPEDERRQGGVMSTLGGLAEVGRNRAFMVFLITVGLFSVPFFAYIAVGSYIYIDFFGTSPQGYTYFFAATSAFMALGPVLWIRASSRGMTPRLFTHGVFALCLAAGAVLLGWGSTSVWVFCAALMLFCLAESAVRPYATNILLSQQERDTGSASSLINFVFNVMGVLGMALAVLPWPNYVVGIGVLMTACTALALLLWIWLLKSKSMHIKELE
ncbi:MAG: multidrug effflux MFS transporter [Eggerthellaceae bacterium]|nr:multidrug effflux MFS transporter [Eggerthellaceae bacterium]